MDDETAAEVETDRTTAAERVPVQGAYNITEIGDSLKVGWWEGERRLIKWRNLRWWALGAAVVSVPGVVLLFAPTHLMLFLVIMAVCAIPGVKAVVWYVEIADKWATMQLKRKQVRHR